jgi:hypothetical protein
VCPGGAVFWPCVAGFVAVRVEELPKCLPNTGRLDELPEDLGRNSARVVQYGDHDVLDADRLIVAFFEYLAGVVHDIAQSRSHLVLGHQCRPLAPTTVSIRAGREYPRLPAIADRLVVHTGHSGSHCHGGTAPSTISHFHSHPSHTTVSLSFAGPQLCGGCRRSIPTPMIGPWLGVAAAADPAAGAPTIVSAIIDPSTERERKSVIMASQRFRDTAR